MRVNNLFHPKNRIILYSLLVWILSIIFFLIILFTSSSFLSKESQTFYVLMLADGITGMASFIIMILYLVIRIFGKVVLFLFPIAIVILAYFIAIFPLTQKDNTKKDLQVVNSSILLEKNLNFGSSGEDVVVLKSALVTDNLLNKNLVTGYYGTQTKGAVASFQSKNNIPTSGELNEITRDTFNKYFGKLYNRSYYLSLIPTTIPITILAGNNVNDGQWGIAERVAGTEHGWSMKVGDDSTMASAQEIFDALNKYRAIKGVRGLNWDGNLATYAQERATYFAANGLDDHAGFKSYISNVDNRRRLGFLGLGENASTGYKMTGTHIIEWVFASDAPHDNNQLDSNWSDVGIAVGGTSVDIIFGYDRF